MCCFTGGTERRGKDDPSPAIDPGFHHLPDCCQKGRHARDEGVIARSAESRGWASKKPGPSVTICWDAHGNEPSRVELLGLVGVVLAVAAPVSASACVGTFRSPTGKITCQVSTGGTSGTWVFCQSLQRPQSVRLSREGDVAVCTGRDCLRSRPLNSMRLKYGSSVRFGPFRCSSRRYTISCWVGSFSNRNRHGFGINLHGTFRF
jgi:hypothetical protein